MFLLFQTIEQKIRLAKLKIKRHAMLKERLERVKLRRIVREGGVDIEIPGNKYHDSEHDTLCTS